MPARTGHGRDGVRCGDSGRRRGGLRRGVGTWLRWRIWQCRHPSLLASAPPTASVSIPLTVTASAQSEVRELPACSEHGDSHRSIQPWVSGSVRGPVVTLTSRMEVDLTRESSVHSRVRSAATYMLSGATLKRQAPNTVICQGP